MMNNSFLSLQKTAKVVVIHGERILFCRERQKKLYFLPGHKVENGKKTEDVLLGFVRKITGIPIDKCEYIGATSNFYRLNRFRAHQEFDLVYVVRTRQKPNFSEDGGLDFVWIKIKALHQENILPKLLKEKLVDWFDNRQVFWGSN